ncbi:hypothetical protein BK704_11755, partial [[Bacillus thuringiensis] serovar konkukian]
MSKKTKLTRTITVLGSATLILSSMTGCFGKSETTSKKKSKSEDVSKEKKGDKKTGIASAIDPNTAITEEVAEIVEKNSEDKITTTVKKNLTNEEQKQLKEILDTDAKKELTQTVKSYLNDEEQTHLLNILDEGNVPNVVTQPNKPTDPVIPTPMDKPTNPVIPPPVDPPTDPEKPKPPVDPPTDPEKPKPPVDPPTDPEKPKPPVDPPIDPEKPKPPVDPPTDPEKPKPPTDTEAPVITVKPNITVNIGQNLNPYDLVTVTDNEDANPILSITGSYDTSKTGTIYVTVIAIDKSGNRSSATVPVIVVDPNEGKDTEAPIITVKPDVTVNVGQSLSVNDLVTVTDNADSNPVVKINGDYDTSKAGNIEVEVIAVDSSGNQATVKVPVKVVDPNEGKDTEAPIIT